MSGFEITLRTSAARPAFAPTMLFPQAAAAIWLDPSDLATMTQDAAGTMPAAVDAPVGRIADKSGRGNHATQSAAASRPMLRREANGIFALEFDGVDDFLLHPFGATGGATGGGASGDVTLSCAAQRNGGTGDIGLFLATSPGARLQAAIWAQTLAPDWGSFAAGAFRSGGHDASIRAVMSVVGRAGPDTQRMFTNGVGGPEFTGSFGGDGNDRRAIGREFVVDPRNPFRGRLYALAGVARALDADGLAALVRHQAERAGVPLAGATS